MHRADSPTNFRSFPATARGDIVLLASAGLWVPTHSPVPSWRGPAPPQWGQRLPVYRCTCVPVCAVCERCPPRRRSLCP